MRVAVITEQPLNKQHGTGAQILRLLDGQNIPFFHFYTWDMFGRSDTAKSYLVSERAPRVMRGRRVIMRVQTALGLSWWRNDQVNPRRIRSLIQNNDLHADVAYIVIACEQTARHALSLLKYLSCPYVVHIMDLFHEKVEPEKMPGLKELVQGAHKVFVITEPIQDQIRTLGGPEPEVIRVGQTLLPHLAKPPTADEVRIVMIGRPYPEGAEVLAEAWPHILTRFPGARLDYAGAHFHTLPETLRQIARDNGQISDPTALHDFLVRRHVAFLCGPVKLDHIGLYSLPSRTTDYFAAGLPLIACVARGSATERVFQESVRDGVQIARDTEQILTALQALTRDSAEWYKAQEAVQQFALREYDINKIRKRVLESLASACSQTKNHLG